ncbi:MAG: hypothetical protein RR472_09085, partial [Anaerovoracaceae bacterium]
MKCGVRFCGGCNPRFDRGEVLKELKNERANVDFLIAEEGVEYDYLIVIGGCTNCCASHCQFSTKEGLVKMWDREHIDKVLESIDEIANK